MCEEVYKIDLHNSCYKCNKEIEEYKYVIDKRRQTERVRARACMLFYATAYISVQMLRGLL